ACIDLLGEHVLMHRAGQAVARLALARWPHARRVSVVCGPGNNGGDGLIAACLLKQAGLEVRVHLIAPPRPGTDAAWALAQTQAHELVPLATAPDPHADDDLIVDALYGAGLRGSLRDDARGWTRAMQLAGQQHGTPILAVDLPSGLQADSGQPDPSTPACDLTLALLCLR
ncbi:MAG: NAD(P)H-hydrate epimerase, partial [Rhodobacteraceae bacterium]|nr:NAD(P)H-hydrate epimerase [Paracoccaceae bacterium]